MAKMVSLRLDEGLLQWADEYAKHRGVTRTALLEAAVVNFREDCERGVPELRAAAQSQAALSGRVDERGVGDCPDRPEGFGHLWALDAEKVNRCRFCGMLGREFLQGASAARSGLFATLRTPASAHGVKPKKAA